MRQKENDARLAKCLKNENKNNELQAFEEPATSLHD